MGISDLDESQLALIRGVRERLKMTKVVATRALKTKKGDFFVGMSAAWDTQQDDAGRFGTDLISAMDEQDTQIAVSQGGMSPLEARVAACMLAMEVDLQAHAAALAGSAITEGEYRQACHGIKANYGRLIAQAVAKVKE